MTLQILSLEFRQRCENIALTKRHQLGLYGYSPLSARRLAAYLSVNICFPYEIAGLDTIFVDHLVKSSTWSAITLLIEPRLIVANPSHTPARFESNIMHELAHLLLNHKPEALGLINSNYAARQYAARQEKEAEYLGGCLQIPSVGLDYAQQLNWNKEKIANYYGASKQMVQYRMNMTGHKC